MTCLEIEDKPVFGSGSVRCVILADTTPATLPTTGENVDGLSDNMKIAPGSVLLCLDTSKKYIMSEAGTFTEWTA